MNTPVNHIQFPPFRGIRCLMMPYIQGDPESVPLEYRRGYESIIESCVIERGQVGRLTIDESVTKGNAPHRGTRARFSRALHTEAGWRPNNQLGWGGGGWGRSSDVHVDWDTQILLANNIDQSCALWDRDHAHTSQDGDIGDLADQYPYETATLMNAGAVHRIGVLTPHESLKIAGRVQRQFLRIVGRGVRGRELYFTQNPLVGEPA